MEIEKIKNKAKQMSSEFFGECTPVIDLMGNTPITSIKDLKTFLRWTAIVKEKHNEINKTKDKLVKSLKDVVSQLEDLFEPSLRALKSAESISKEKINTFIKERANEVDETLRMVKNEKGDKARNLLAKADELTIPKLKGLSIREQWTGEIENYESLFEYLLSMCLHMFLKIDEKALKEHTKLLKGDPGFPGWKAELKKTITITASKVE